MQVTKGFIHRNKVFINGLDKESRTTLFFLLAIQFVFYLYYLLFVPLHYDEWFSWHIFSGNSFWMTMSYYPAPNNHVFYNLVSRCFVVTGIDREIAVRLPSLIASLFAGYYFFKICRNFFNPLISLVLLAYLITLYPFITYSFMGRGYSFLNLFCVLTIYSSWQLSENYREKRYRVLFIMAQFLGLYSVPSFLYALMPVYLVLIFYVIKQKSLRVFFLFVLDASIAAILVACAYSFILYNNDPKNLLNPNGGTNMFSMSDPDAFENLNFYINTLFFELFNSGKLRMVTMLVLISFLYHLFTLKQQSRFLLFLSVGTFFSPVIILIVHQVFPFGRNWLYLAVPVTMCYGFILQAVLNSVGQENVFAQGSKLKIFLCFLVVSASVFQLYEFGAKHRTLTPWDYQIDFFRRKKLAPVAHQVLSIAKTNSSTEFYPAEVITLICEKNNPGKQVKLAGVNEVVDPDLLILNGDELEKYRKKLLDYDFAYVHDNIWFYFRKMKTDAKTLN